MKKKTKFIIAIVLALIAIIVAWSIARLSKENKRLESNIEAINKSMQSYKTADSLNAVSVMQLTLKTTELEQYDASLYDECKSLGLQIKRLENVAETATESHVVADIPIHDTIIINNTDNSLDTLRAFQWQDNWCSIDGLINNDEVQCDVANRDTLIQVVHRIPHSWWIFKWGTKAIRQEVISKNPHTNVVFSEYLAFR